MDLEKTTLKTKKESEQLQEQEKEILKEATAMTEGDSQKELTTYSLPPDVKPLSQSNLSSTSDTASTGVL